MNRQIGQTFTLQGCCFIEEPYKIIRLYLTNIVLFIYVLQGKNLVSGKVSMIFL